MHSDADWMRKNGGGGGWGDEATGDCQTRMYHFHLCWQGRRAVIVGRRTPMARRPYRDCFADYPKGQEKFQPDRCERNSNHLPETLARTLESTGALRRRTKSNQGRSRSVAPISWCEAAWGRRV